MKRRVVATIAAITLAALTLAGCGGKKEKETEAPAQAATTAEATQTEA